MYYDLDIRELPGSGSPPPKQPAQVSEAPTTDQTPSAPVEVPTDSRQDAGQGKKVEAPRARTITKIRVKARLQTLPFLSPSKLLTKELTGQKLRILVLV